MAAVVAAENADLECCIGENDSSLQPKQQILHCQSLLTKPSLMKPLLKKPLLTKPLLTEPMPMLTKR